ncbi:MAG TPA: hypothetical protein VF508_07155 [Pyrinomonadaceae bacterium]|jgi:hypothetical protein
MADTNDSRYNTGNPILDAVHFLCDAKFAVLPPDAARQLGELEKNFWGGLRWFAEKNIGWIEDSLAGADRLREEWRRGRHCPPGPEPIISPPPPPEGIG